jgi:hypothetical protein
MKYSTLNPDRLKETQSQLAERIAKRFPTSGLSKVAVELVAMVEEAGARAETIRRPNWPLRAGVVLLCLGALGLGVRLATSLEVKTDLKDAMGLFGFVDAALRTCFFLGAAVLFLVSLEIRLKRRRALAALHELRAMAHVVEMHQIAKDPEGLVNALAAGTDISTHTTKTLFDLNRYLNYCTELLSIISKIAALYVQDFPDAPTVAAADAVENLCSGVSQRIWEKIMVLDQIVRQQPETPSSDGTPPQKQPGQ